MRCYALALVGLFVVLSLIRGALGQTAGQSQCQLRFVQSATACMQNSSLNIQNVQYVASNGTSGSPPSENIASFRARLCMVKPQLEICGQTVTQRLSNSTLCMSQIEKQSIISSFQTTFGGLDSNCALPCRYAMMDQLRQCFQLAMPVHGGRHLRRQIPVSFSDLDLVKTSLAADNWDQLWHMCRNRQAVMSCFQQKVMTCRDSARVMANMDLNLRSFEKGLDLICQNTGVYLNGIHCFKRPIPEVRMCYTNLNMQMMQLKRIAPQPTADQVSLAQYCSLRLRQIECEMEAWARSQYRTCERVITGFRNELACRLLPDRCRMAFPSLVSNNCNQMNYYADERWRYNAAGRREGSLLAAIPAVLLAVLSLRSM